MISFACIPSGEQGACEENIRRSIEIKDIVKPIINESIDKTNGMFKTVHIIQRNISKAYCESNIEEQINSKKINPQSLSIENKSQQRNVNIQNLSPIAKPTLRLLQITNKEDYLLSNSFYNEAALQILQNQMPQQNRFSQILFKQKQLSPFKRKKIFQNSPDKNKQIKIKSDNMNENVRDQKINNVKINEYQEQFNFKRNYKVQDQLDLGCSFFSQFIEQRPKTRSRSHRKIFSSQKKYSQGHNTFNNNNTTRKEYNRQNLKQYKNKTISRKSAQIYQANKNKIKKLGGKKKNKNNQSIIELQKSIEIQINQFQKINNDCKKIQIKLISNFHVEPLEF